MRPTISRSTRTVGFWSAVLATLFALAYDLGQIAEWLGWLGSAGGPENSSTVVGYVVLFTPSLLLAPAFLFVMVSVNDFADASRRIWTVAAVAFATVYTALIAINYYSQLTWVVPRLAAGRLQGVEPFVFTPFDSFLYAVDILGYSFMSAATLCASRALGATPHERWARRFLLANGLVLPFIALQMFWHSLIWLAALWAVVFPAGMWALARMFHSMPRDATLAGA